MKFLLDQSTDASIIPYLNQLGHDATRIASDYPAGLPDQEVLSISHQEERILITDDRDFGKLVFRLRLPHPGIIYLRLGEYAPLTIKIERISYVLTHYTEHLDQFMVVTRTRVRIRPSS